MDFIGRFVFQGQMWPFMVVDVHGLADHLFGLLQIGGPLQQEFVLEDAVDAVCW